jgi:hypothetical protein
MPAGKADADNVINPVIAPASPIETMRDRQAVLSNMIISPDAPGNGLLPDAPKYPALRPEPSKAAQSLVKFCKHAPLS